jgi:putative ABC transport system permease protein
MRYALTALARRKGRSAATALGIGLAVGLVVVLLAVSSGVQASSNRLADSSGIDLLGTSGNTSLSSGVFPPLLGAHRLPSEFRSADSNVATASPWLVNSLTLANASLFSRVNSSDVPVSWSPTGGDAVGWIPGENEGIIVPTVTSGPGFSTPGDPHYANGTYDGPSTGEVVLDQGLAGVLGVVPGDLIWASPQGIANASGLPSWYAHATAFRVVGISGPFWLLPSALLGFFYLSELQQVVDGASADRDAASLVLIHLNDPTNPSGDQSTLSAAFAGLTFFTLSNLLGEVEQTVALYRTFGTLIGLIGIVVATLFTTTILLMSVEDRSRELALLRALGYPRATVGRFVAEEGLLLALAGVAIGLPLGWIGATLLNYFLSRTVMALPEGFSFVSFDFSIVADALVIIVAIGLVASILPAARAMTLPVSEELRAP